MTLIEPKSTCLSLFFPLSLLIFIIIFALVILRFVFILVLVLVLVLVLSFFFFALIPFPLIFVFFFDKRNLTVYFLLLLLRSGFCFIDDRGTESTVFQVSWTDIKVVLLRC